MTAHLLPPARRCGGRAWLPAAALLPSMLLLAGTLQAQDSGPKPVYRCPGPPVLYTDALTPQEARDKGCRTIEGAPVTVVQVPRPRPAGASGSSGTPAPSGAPAPAAASGAPASADTPRNAGERVDPAAQRARDTDAKRILTEELQREEERLAQLKREFNNGEPERRGDERNFQRYADRVAEMKAAITRKESDIAAIKRELAKLPS